MRKILVKSNRLAILFDAILRAGHDNNGNRSQVTFFMRPSVRLHRLYRAACDGGCRAKRYSLHRTPFLFVKLAGSRSERCIMDARLVL
jgi:hypothetical protein